MNVLLIILLMIAIGALIGGMTNYLAIKMLFRPYRPIYIRNWKLPFTPGLIPKRQAELAEQLGHLVTNHLVKADAISKKLVQSEFQKQIISMVQSRFDEYLESDQKTIEVIQQFKQDLTVLDVESYFKEKVADQLANMYEHQSTRTLGDVLPDDVKHSIDEQLPVVAAYILQQVDAYINSPEGQKKLSETASEFLQSQGFLGSMVSSYFGEEGLVEKVTPAINQFIRSTDTHETIETLIRAEWLKWQHKQLSGLRNQLFDDTLESRVANYLVNELQVSQHLHEPVSTWLTKYEQVINQELIPNGVKLLIGLLSSQVEKMMKTMDVSNMVRQEVVQFDVVRLEKMVLEITKREFNMITYLGAVLGGTIGLVQGLIVMLIS
ncbi:DUF445 domain-containing protein [Alkalibacillus silvisoli]|uniref:DUF445 family protein n=1 Tax=Alkalibacillus silvisoli TaxID=392823 RepID=A0ABP3K4K7_9BACI